MGDWGNTRPAWAKLEKDVALSHGVLPRIEKLAHHTRNQCIGENATSAG